MMIPSKRTRISAYALLLREQSILLVRCSADTDPPGEWTLPGGGIEFGEDPAHAAVREVKEETGYDIALGDVLTIDSRVIRAREIDHHVIRIIYAAKILAGELAVEVNGSTDACEWIPLDRVADHPLVELARIAARLARQLDGE